MKNKKECFKRVFGWLLCVAMLLTVLPPNMVATAANDVAAMVTLDNAPLYSEMDAAEKNVVARLKAGTDITLVSNMSKVNHLKEGCYDLFYEVYYTINGTTGTYYILNNHVTQLAKDAAQPKNSKVAYILGGKDGETACAYNKKSENGTVMVKYSKGIKVYVAESTVDGWSRIYVSKLSKQYIKTEYLSFDEPGSTPAAMPKPSPTTKPVGDAKPVGKVSVKEAVIYTAPDMEEKAATVKANTLLDMLSLEKVKRQSDATVNDFYKVSYKADGKTITGYIECPKVNVYANGASQPAGTTREVIQGDIMGSIVKVYYDGEVIGWLTQNAEVDIYEKTSSKAIIYFNGVMAEIVRYNLVTPTPTPSITATPKPTAKPKPTNTPKPTATPTPTPTPIPEDTILKNLQIYVEEPVAGAKPAKVATIVQNDVAECVSCEWSGTFNEDGGFIPKNTYTVKVTVKVRDGVDKIIPTKDYDYYLNDKKLNLIVPLKGGKTFWCSGSYTIAMPEDVVDVTKVYTMEQADALNPVVYAEKSGGDLIVNEALIKEFRRGKVSPIDYVLFEEEMRISAAKRVLIDYPADSKLSQPSGAVMYYHANAKEFWLSPEMDVAVFLKAFLDDPRNATYTYTSEGASTWDFTLYVSEEALPNGLLNMEEDLGIAFKSDQQKLLKFRTLLYSGDVYEAFEKAGRGEEVGKEWCPGHEYTAKIQTTDRTYADRTCQVTNWFYYSCKYCGKCEYNDNHVFAMDEFGNVVNDVENVRTHVWTCIIDPSHYLGVNAEGDPVYAYTCKTCGFDYREIESGIGYYTKERFDYECKYDKELGQYYTYKTYVEKLTSDWEKYQLGWALEATVDHNTTRSFAVEAEKVVAAKVNDGFHNEVGWAAQNNVADLALLGNDYTKEMTRLQAASVAVRLAEELSGKTIIPAVVTTFTDTNNEYALKAYAAGILADQTGTAFNSDSKLTREQLATYIYRALMWVRDNSDIRFTPYDSKLVEYTDANSLSSYAKEPMAFMTALGLMDGDKGKLNPKSTVSIEQALKVAYLSLDADKLGWYQCYKAEGMYPYYRNNEVLTQTSYSVGDRVWVIGVCNEINHENWRIVVDPYNGLVREIPTGDFRPIKDLKEGDAELYYQWVPKKK